MKKFLFILLALVFSQLAYGQSLSWSPVWKIENLANPESVVYDAAQGVVYVSNQDIGGKNGEASIGKLSINGEVLEKEWVKGLNEPKGIAILKNRLFVSDVTDLVEIDIEKAKIIQRYPGEGAKFLNDVAIDKEGRVYVSDMFTSSIYRLDTHGKFELWVQDAKLQNPNGLLLQGDNLLISAWGSFNNGKPSTADKGFVLQISLVSRKIEVLSDSPIGNLDGLQEYKDGSYLISDWITGEIYEYKNGVEKRILDLGQSAGDIAYIKEENLLLVPMANQGQVIAYRPVDESTQLHWFSSTWFSKVNIKSKKSL